MNRYLGLSGLLFLCLLISPPLALADHHMTDDHMMNDHMMDQDNMGHHDGGPGSQHGDYRRYDPVKNAERRLGQLEKELKLTADQQSAWKTYSNVVMTAAQDMASRMEQFHSNRGEMRDLDTASKLEKMSAWMRERADRLEQMASDTRAFQQALTSEQQQVFDQFWKKHSRYGKSRRSRPSQQ